MKKATLKEIKLIPIDGIHLVKPGDDLPGIIIRTANASKIEWIEGDILVIAQKIISKSEDSKSQLLKLINSLIMNFISSIGAL